MSTKPKRIIVTGGNSGVGKATAVIPAANHLLRIESLSVR